MGDADSAPKTSLHASVVDDLGARIARGDLATGSTMTLDELATQYGVSRTVIREAVRELQSLGMVDSRRRVGSEVLPLARWSVFHPKVIGWRIDSGSMRGQLTALTELRLALEPVAAALAAQRRSATQAEKLVDLANELYEAGVRDDMDRFVSIDVEFHTLILHAADNELFSAHADSVSAALRGRAKHGVLPHPVVHSFELHQAVAESIMRRDPVCAQSVMREILTDVVGEIARQNPRRYGTGPVSG
ncbi:MAG: FCD domain-containing protein [Micropruina sp.]